MKKNKEKERVKVEIREKKNIWGLEIEKEWRKLRRRIRMGKIYRWRLKGFKKERIMIEKYEMRVEEKKMEKELYNGSLEMEGRIVEKGGL